MNILFVLYWDFRSNSANPLTLYARELHSAGHSCAIAVPSGLETADQYDQSAFRPVLFQDVLTDATSVFPDGRPADVIHACTPREVVRRFVTFYMAKCPTPLVIYLEDNERWIALHELGLQEKTLRAETDLNIACVLPDGLSHPFRYPSFIGLADAVAVIQDKLKIEVPPWVHCETVMIGVDLELFSPQPPDARLRKKYAVGETERVIVYHGGVDQYKRTAIETLCKAIGIINQRGYPCRLLRTGIRPLAFLDTLTAANRSKITDLGLVPKIELPGILALADVFVQPGEIDPFEDLRLPGKIPEFLGMARPVVIPDVNIAHLFTDGVNAALLRTGSAEEIANKCIDLFSDAEKADAIGQAGRLLAEQYFDVKTQARRLEQLYKAACAGFDPDLSSAIWQTEHPDEPVPLRLVRKLRLLADRGNRQSESSPGDLMREHACYMELMHQRVKGLEQGIDGATATLRRAIAEREKEIQTLLASTSWRLTQPLRTVRAFLTTAGGSRAVSLFKNAMRVGKAADESVKAVFRRSGGGRRVLGKILRLLKREGLKGFIQKWASLRIEHMRYSDWICCYDAITDEVRAIMHRRIDGFAKKPLISVLMPVYNTNPKWLVEAIESVRKQLYPYWELCIADDASTDPRIRSTLERYVSEDSRIKVVFRSTNGHICAASNTALEAATGEYIALLDHDDLLSEHALFWVANEISRYPDVKLIYSDEDKVDVAGKRSDPHFKCDWNVDLFYSHNLITHLGVYRTDLLRTIEGFRVGYEGAQDYDLALRSIERIETKDIRHIPRILYHWRMHPESTATGTAAKPYALDAGKRAITEHLERRGVAGRVQPREHPGMYRVRYELPMPMPMVSLIIPVRNELKLTQQCVTSVLRKTTYRNYEILIVDNGSDDTKVLNYLQSLKSDSRIRIIRDDRPFNFPALNNAAVKQARGEVLALVNNDIEVISPDWLSEMVSHAVRTEIGAVGARLLYPNGTLQHGGVILGIGGVAGHANKGLPRYQYGYFARAVVIQSVSAVTAACLVVRKELYEKVGGFNEDLKVAYNDIDFCLKIREAGYRNLFTPYAELYHHESASRGYENTPDKQLRLEAEGQYMKQRWGDLLLNDPAYNPNLTLEWEDFSLAWPPRVDV
jgi:glycosyltransferase involved in cell wall biosynthesis